MGLLGDIVAALRNPARRRIQREAAALTKYELDSERAAGIQSSPGAMSSPGRNGVTDDSLDKALRVEATLKERVAEYERMDQYGDITTALDSYADEATVPRAEDQKAIWFTSSNKEIADIGNKWLERSIEAEKHIWQVVRELCKYGNLFGELIFHPDYGVIGIGWVPSATVRRIETRTGFLLGFVHDPTGNFQCDMQLIANALAAGAEVPKIQGIRVFEHWQMVHLRLSGKSINETYGVAAIEPARWHWRRLLLMEDAMIVNKLSRGPARFAFYVNTGSVTGRDRWATVNEYVAKFKRKKFVDSSGKVRFAKDVMAPDDDWFFPMSSTDDPTRVENISGTDFQQTEPVTYFDAKMKGSLKMHAARFGYGNESDTNKSQNIGLDITFARLILRIQRSTRLGFREMFRMHLLANQIDADSDDLEFDARMEPPSQIFELARAEVWGAKLDIMQRWKEFADTAWILQKIAGFTEEEAKEIADRWFAERERSGDLDTKIEANRIKATSFGDQDQEDQGGQESVMVIKQLSKLAEQQKAMRQQMNEHWDQRLATDSAARAKVGELGRLLRELKAATYSAPPAHQSRSSRR